MAYDSELDAVHPLNSTVEPQAVAGDLSSLPARSSSAPPDDLVEEVGLEAAGDRGATQHCVLELAIFLAATRVGEHLGGQSDVDLAWERVVLAVEIGDCRRQLEHVLARRETARPGSPSQRVDCTSD